MKAIHTLNKVRDNSNRIRLRVAEVERLKRDAVTLKGLSYDKEPVSGGKPGDLSGTVARVIDTETAIRRDVDELIRKREKIRAVLRRIPNAVAEAVLIARYVDAMSWDEAESEIHYTRQQLSNYKDYGVRYLETNPELLEEIESILHNFT